MSWTVYILRCGDDTLYTGITNNLEARVVKHEQGAGAKYTKGRGPFQVIYQEEYPDRGEATRRELQIKDLSREDKLKLVQTGPFS